MMVGWREEERLCHNGTTQAWHGALALVLGPLAPAAGSEAVELTMTIIIAIG